jgi:hypothetical protein
MIWGTVVFKSGSAITAKTMMLRCIGKIVVQVPPAWQNGVRDVRNRSIRRFKRAKRVKPPLARNAKLFKRLAFLA